MRSNFLFALAVVFALVAHHAQAGGPRYVAGVSYFNSGTKGTPLTWPQGTISYYTDQGNLSAQLPGASADAFVADAFSRWTSISTAAVSSNRAGQFAEDVSSANVMANSDGSISMPADIEPDALSQPLAIIYDTDGSVIDALVGQGASDPSLCASNSVLGSPDSFSVDAHLAHALIILNGNCAQSASQLPDLKYHLVRMLGRVLGLDWAQANINVVAGNPAPTAADYSGFALMHEADPVFCLPVSKCYPAGVDPAQPKLDDQAALSRLYPVTAQNLSAFPSKKVFSTISVRIHGTVFFADANGQPAQPMQGVNVVARWVDPTTNIPSRSYVVASVSGFLFHGNAGNPITGSLDGTGEPYNRFGSDDASVEGFFDLAGLPIPDSSGTAQYQLSVEPVDPVWSYGMGPYGALSVTPSGTARIFVSASLGQDIQQDILMSGSALFVPNWFGTTTYSFPAALPSVGDWLGALGIYGDTNYFSFQAQANRTLFVAVTALDEFGNASENKAQPVVGIWSLAAPQTDAASVSAPPLNTPMTGETRLDAAVNTTTSFRIGIADARGDGRSDFRYRAHVLYADSVTPSRASVAGGTPVALQGLGFRVGSTVSLGSINAPLLAFSANQLVALVPPAKDGVQNITVADPATGGTSTMTGALTYGAGPNDLIKLISGASQAAPVGGPAASPVTVQVLAPDGSTPVAGASVFFSAAPAVSFSACGGAASCTILTNQNGQASSNVTVLSPVVSTITVQLALASYNPPQQVQATLFGTSTALDIALTPQAAWIAQGATLSLPLTTRVLSNGKSLAGRIVNFQVLKGSALLTSASAISDSNGLATSTLQISSLAGDVQVSACIANQPVDTPCLSFRATSVPPSSLRLHPVAGTCRSLQQVRIFSPSTWR